MRDPAWWNHTLVVKDPFMGPLVNALNKAQPDGFLLRHAMGHSNLKLAFAWADSPEGMDYWRNIHEQIVAKERKHVP